MLYQIIRQTLAAAGAIRTHVSYIAAADTCQLIILLRDDAAYTGMPTSSATPADAALWYR
jgi:hypothetical protein